VTTTFCKDLGPHASVGAMVYEASSSGDDGSVAGKENGADVETAAARAAGMLVCCCCCCCCAWSHASERGTWFARTRRGASGA